MASKKTAGAMHEVSEQMKDFGSKHPFAFLGALEKLFDEYLVQKAPFQLPKGGKEFIVKVAPYLTIIFLLMSIPLILGLFGMGMYRNTMMVYAGGKAMFYLTALISLVIFILEIMALPGLFAKSRKGWNLVFYAQLISVVMSVVQGNILSAVLSLVISMYILFQIKSYYR